MGFLANFNIKTFNPKLNMFYTNKNEDNFSIFITGISVLIDDKEMDIADAYIKLITSNIISYKYMAKTHMLACGM